jgi:cytoskeletal protein CcmA (bactofilin family)
MAEIQCRNIEESDIDTVLADDIDFVGNVTFTDSLMVTGNLKGTIRAAGNLFIGESAHVEATIEADIVAIRGKVKGDVLATTRVELASTSGLEGDITAPDIVMESGCKFNGICTMKSPKEVGR